jgi:hypothetical protein
VHGKVREAKHHGVFVYPYRIANLGLAVIEGLIDADHSPFTNDIERLSSRVHWRHCSRSLGGSSRGGEEEMGRRQCRRPRRQERVVPPPHKSGNESTVTRRATPNHHYSRTGWRGSAMLGPANKQRLI